MAADQPPRRRKRLSSEQAATVKGAGASIESIDASLIGAVRAGGAHSWAGAMAELVTLLARSSDTESGGVAALVSLRRATGAREVRIEFQYEGAVRTVLSDRGSGVPSPRFVETQAFPIVAAGEELGRLLLDAGAPLDDEAVALCRTAADLLAIAASRDLRMRHLELEVHAQMRQVAEQRRFVEQVVDSLPFGLYVIDREYRIHAWNHKRETGMLGVSRVDALGRTIFDVLSRQPADLLKQEFDEVFATGRMQQFHMESMSTGERRSFRISKIPMSLDHESVTHVITVGEDITEWKAALDRIAQSEKLAAIGQLAAGVMHEVNNPLATIAACAESLSFSTSSLPPGAAEMLRIVDLEVQRCKKIVDGLLDFSRPKAASRVPVDLGGVVRQAQFLMRHHPQFKRVKVVEDLTDELLMVEGDADQLVQVIIALAMNAFDATPPGKRVTLRTRSEVDDGRRICVVEVEDEGPGVPRAVADRIFEPFFTTKPPGKGTGLGLSICYGIVTDHGGTFELVQADVPGATFRIGLPAHD